jgi:hypothetical protein
MVVLPEGTVNLARCADYGVDEKGLRVFFGLRMEDGDTKHFALNHAGLGNLINYLQVIAQQAQLRRMKTNPVITREGVRKSSSNPVRQLYLASDITGHWAALVCTMEDGTPVEAQFSFDLLNRLHNLLPGILVDMKNRRGAYVRPQ